MFKMQQTFFFAYVQNAINLLPYRQTAICLNVVQIITEVREDFTNVSVTELAINLLPYLQTGVNLLPYYKNAINLLHFTPNARNLLPYVQNAINPSPYVQSAIIPLRYMQKAIKLFPHVQNAIYFLPYEQISICLNIVQIVREIREDFTNILVTEFAINLLSRAVKYPSKHAYTHLKVKESVTQNCVSA